ncbi:hypothetical protein chiPu_0011432 [Chiloscyllium punctatum]|uniref:Uncharacterized protein n=1 Tax=Chiloscyllium punctatum TaxID=137246 RepID=A0A401SRE9_CHIPU|nr:hypothetical protein [Chiloscyllium punctatum]
MKPSRKSVLQSVLLIKTTDITEIRNLIDREFDKIRQKASTAWTEEHEHRLRSITTYSAEHRIKQLDEPTQGRVRPNSPTRLHRPHPPEV